MNKPLFVLPLSTLLGWAGCRDSDADRFIWLARSLGVNLKKTPNTVRKNIHKDKRTKQTAEKFEEAISAIKEKVHAQLPSDEDLIRYGKWKDWIGFADYADITLPKTFLPKTRQHIRKLAAQDRELALTYAGVFPDYKRALRLLLDNPFTRTLYPQDTKPILDAFPLPATPMEFAQSIARNKLFHQWCCHCLVSLLMDLLAYGELEYQVNGLFAPSIIRNILPQLHNGSLLLPIRLQLESWKTERGISLEQMAEYVDGNGKDKLRTLKTWLYDEHEPSEDSVNAFIKRMEDDEMKQDLAQKKFRLARLLTRLCKEVKRIDQSDEQCVAMFESFIRHRDRHLAEQEECPPARRC